MKYVPKTRLENVICPIVEGQIRHFLHEHPEVLANVNWYKGKKSESKATIFTNSLSKRIVRDLTCEMTIARLEQALLEPRTETP